MESDVWSCGFTCSHTVYIIDVQLSSYPDLSRWKKKQNLKLSRCMNVSKSLSVYLAYTTSLHASGYHAGSGMVYKKMYCNYVKITSVVLG